MEAGWYCPACGKAHAPWVQTCPESPATAPVPPYWPVGYDPRYPGCGHIGGPSGPVSDGPRWPGEVWPS